VNSRPEFPREVERKGGAHVRWSDLVRLVIHVLSFVGMPLPQKWASHQNAGRNGSHAQGSASNGYHDTIVVRSNSNTRLDAPQSTPSPYEGWCVYAASFEQPTTHNQRLREKLLLLFGLALSGILTLALLLVQLTESAQRFPLWTIPFLQLWLLWRVREWTKKAIPEGTHFVWPWPYLNSAFGPNDKSSATARKGSLSVRSISESS